MLKKIIFILSILLSASPQAKDYRFKLPLNDIHSASASNIRKLYLEIPDTSMAQLMQSRDCAINSNFLKEDCKQYVSGSITDGKIPVQIRIKGDLPDHWKRDRHWSLRIELPSDQTFYGCNRFNIAHPDTRNGAWEWLEHQVLKKETGISLKFHFIQVFINQKDMGAYILEQQANASLGPQNQLPSGPVLRFDTGNNYEYFSRRPKIYQKKKYPPALRRQAKQLLLAFKDGKNTTSDVFDLKILARFMAIQYIFGSRHGTELNNIRFYYHPEKKKMFPIGYDMLGGLILDYNLNKNLLMREKPSYPSEDIFKAQLFKDTEFLKVFLTEAERFCSDSWFESLLENYREPLSQLILQVRPLLPQARFQPVPFNLQNVPGDNASRYLHNHLKMAKLIHNQIALKKILLFLKKRLRS